jgi:hypothetical protein
VLPGLSDIPAAGDERVPDSGMGPAATTAHPPPLTLLRRRKQVAAEIGAGLLRILDQTGAIAEEAKQRIRGSVEPSVQQAAPFLVWRTVLSDLNQDPYLQRLTAAVAAVPVLFVSVLPQFRDFGRSGAAAPVAGLLLVVVTVAGLLIGVGLMSVLIDALRRFGGRVLAVAATAALLYVAAAGVGAVLGGSWFAATVAWGLKASAIWFVSFLVVAEGLHLVQVFMVRRTIRKVPDAEVVTTLLVALLAAEVPTPNPTGLATQLQQLADTMRRALPRKFPGIHPDQQHWLREEAASIAAAVHHMSMEVLLGGERTVAPLAPKLGAMLVHVAERDWASLERAAPRTVGPARRLVPVLLSVVVAAVPLLLGLSLRWRLLPVDADPDLVDSLVRFGVVWAALHLLVALYPQATEQIDRTGRILDLMP